MDHRYLPLQDLLGSEGPEHFQQGLDELWYHHGDLPPNDLRLSFSSYDPFYQRPVDSQHPFTTYDPIAHGFSHRHVRIHADSVLPQLAVFDQDYHNIDQFRNQRHLSPTDPSGLTHSSNTDSSVSDYAHSPDAFRNPHPFAFANTSQGVYGTPMAMGSTSPHTWHSQPSFIPTHPSAPLPAHHTVRSMRDLQVTPDPEQEDEPMDDRDVLQPKINYPEELEISEQIVTPPDSGLDQSVEEDETMKGDEDSIANESDNGSEFTPRTKPPRRQSGAKGSHSLREPRRPRAIIDTNARVTKPRQAREETHHITPRSKAKKKPPVTEKDASNSKSFPCTFHHYGCYATFANKNEWKRHVSSQHLQLGYYRCDMGTCSPDVELTQNKGFNDFNRKDLFTQHCRRMHAPWSGTKNGEEKASKKEKDSFEKQLEVIRTRCWVDRRKAPQKTKCGFCGKKFVDSAESRGWDERMEHVGRHFERDHYKSEDEKVDDGLKDWAIAEGVVKEGKRKGEFWLIGFEPAKPHRAPRGERRSQRLVKDEGDDALEPEEGGDDVDADAEDEQATIEVQQHAPAEGDDDSDADAVAETDTEADAEDEDDE